MKQGCELTNEPSTVDSQSYHVIAQCDTPPTFELHSPEPVSVTLPSDVIGSRGFGGIPWCNERERCELFTLS